MLTRSGILNKLKELKPYLLAEYSIKKIGVFGSISNNTYSDESDIDILVELERAIGWKFFSMEIYLKKVFGRKIDLVTKNALKGQIKETIEKEK